MHRYFFIPPTKKCCIASMSSLSKQWLLHSGYCTWGFCPSLFVINILWGWRTSVHCFLDMEITQRSSNMQFLMWGGDCSLNLSSYAAWHSAFGIIDKLFKQLQPNLFLSFNMSWILHTCFCCKFQGIEKHANIY